MDAEIPAAATRPEPADEELLAQAREGSAEALEALLVRYQPHIYRFGLRMCGNADDASDVVQESLMAVARSVRGFRGDASLATWLYTISRRACMRMRRRRSGAPAREEPLDATGDATGRGLADPAPGPEQVAADREVQAALVAAIDRLEPPQREVLLLRDVEGLKAHEVAAVLGITVQAVKSRLHRARLAVRRGMAPLLDPPPDRPSPPPCADVALLFSRYLEGEIAAPACARMEAHLAGCGACRGACDSLKRTLALCRQSPEPTVPAPVAASVKAAIRAFLGPEVSVPGPAVRPPGAERG
jgi:RNA polymerase sigma-70 factor (ECF subfamily)